MKNPWLALGAFVVAYDAWLIGTDRRSLSECFRHGHDTRPVVVAAATGYLLAHLYGLLPHKSDALYGFGLMVKPRPS